MNYIDSKYISLISPRLRNFTKKSDYLWNFSCPYCGDSQKNTKKARGFIYRTKTELFYKCHNCSMGTTLPKLIEFMDTNLFNEYRLERYKEGYGQNYTGKSVPQEQYEFEQPKFKTKFNLKSFENLEKSHPAVDFLSRRLIPREYWNDIYYCPNFFGFSNKHIENKFPSLDGDHPRIVIPFRNKDSDIIGYQGRAFGKEIPKYLTVILDKHCPKIYGMDRINEKENIYIVEGPFDSLFIDNCIAVAQGDLRVKKYKDNSILVPDNEPRNKEVCKQIKKFIVNGYKVTLWPRTIIEKDVNEMILSGKTKEEIKTIIDNNTYQGTEALMQFSMWRKVNV